MERRLEHQLLKLNHDGRGANLTPLFKRSPSHYNSVALPAPSLIITSTSPKVIIPLYNCRTARRGIRTSPQPHLRPSSDPL